MRDIHQLFAVVLAACAVSVITPASAAAAKSADRQSSETAGAVGDTVATEDLKGAGLQTIAPGKEGSTKVSRSHHTAQLSSSAKSKAIRRAIAIRRARARKAKKPATG